MPGKQEEKREIKATECEIRFIEFCRGVDFAEFKVLVMNGQPIKAYKTVKSVRFDNFKKGT